MRLDIVGRQSQLERIGPALDELVDAVDLAERVLQKGGAASGGLGRNVGRPE